MHSRRVILAAAVLALGLAGCNKDTPNAPAPKVDSPPATPGAGGPAATTGGLEGNPAGGTPAGAATASTPEGMPPGAGTAKTDQGGLASRPTAGPDAGKEPRPNADTK